MKATVAVFCFASNPSISFKSLIRRRRCRATRSCSANTWERTCVRGTSAALVYGDVSCAASLLLSMSVRKLGFIRFGGQLDYAAFLT